MNIIMNLDQNNIYYLDEKFEINNKGSEFLYIDYENSNWFRTNSTGNMILSKFDGIKNVNEIIESISEVLDFPNNVLMNLFIPFITRAIERKVLLKKGEQHVILDSPFCDYPNDLWIHVTSKCNMNCPFCYSSSGITGSVNLNCNDIIKFVEKIPKEKRKNIIISGGEPFVYTDLKRLVKELKTMGFKITIITNGTAGNHDYPEVLKYIDTLQISIDGSTPEYYEYTRGKGNYQKAVDSLNLAHQLGMRNIVISFTSNSFNIEDIVNLPRFAYDNHVNHIHITRIIPSGRANEIMDKIVPTSNMYKNAITRLSKSILDINSEIKIKRDTEEMILSEDDKTKFITMSVSSDPISKVIEQTKISTCSLANGTVSINYDGKVYSCGCLHLENLFLGTIYDDINEIMERGQVLSNKFCVDNEAMTECFKCKFKYICAGGCRACANAAGNIQGIDPVCDFYKERILETMWNAPIN